MKDYTGIREVKIFNTEELNSALRKGWVLLKILQNEDIISFVAGRYFITEADFSLSVYKREGTV